MSSYCTVVLREDLYPGHKAYHDREYGFRTDDDDVLFERLILEINQAGLSWETVLKKREAMNLAYAGFRVSDVAAFDEEKIEEVLGNPGVIRNRLKVLSAVENAKRVQALQASQGSFSNWLRSHIGLSLEEWTRLMRTHFKFMGPEIVNEFLMSTGYLPGAHQESCPAYQAVIASCPEWLRAVN